MHGSWRWHIKVAGIYECLHKRAVGPWWRYACYTHLLVYYFIYYAFSTLVEGSVGALHSVSQMFDDYEDDIYDPWCCVFMSRMISVVSELLAMLLRVYQKGTLLQEGKNRKKWALLISWCPNFKIQSPVFKIEATKGRQRTVQGKRDTKKYKPEATENKARTQRTHETEGTQDWSEDKRDKLAKKHTSDRNSLKHTGISLLTDWAEVYKEKG